MLVMCANLYKRSGWARLGIPHSGQTAIVETAYMRAAGTSGPVGVHEKLSQNSRLAMSTFQHNSVSEEVPRKACCTEYATKVIN